MAKKKHTPEEMAKNRKTLRRVLTYINGQKRYVAFSLFCAAVSVGTQLLVPVFTGNAIDCMVGKAQVDFDGIVRAAVWIITLTALSALVQWLMSLCNNRIVFSVSRELRNAAIEKIQKLPLRYLDSHPSGDLVSRVIADVDTFSDGLLMGFTQLFTGVLTIICTLSADAAEPLCYQLYFQPYLPVFPAAEPCARRADGHDQRTDRRNPHDSGFRSRAGEHGSL